MDPLRPYLWNGECHSDCESIKGANLVNDLDNGQCVCAEDTHMDPVTGYCLRCQDFSYDCDQCTVDWTDEENPVFECSRCADSYQVVCPDKSGCWNKLTGC